MVTDNLPWQWKYSVKLIHRDSMNFHEINQWLDDNIGPHSQDWSGYGLDINKPYPAASMYLFNKKEHAIYFKTMWVI